MFLVWISYFSLAMKATILCKHFHFIKKFVELDVGLCPSNFSGPSTERISTPTNSPCLRKYWQNYLNFKFSLIFREKQPCLKTLWKGLFASVAQLSLAQSPNLPSHCWQHWQILSSRVCRWFWNQLCPFEPLFEFRILWSVPSSC